VGYGDRSPHTDLEKWVVCLLEILGTFSFGLMAGTLTSIIAEANELQAKRDRELHELKTFLDIKGVEPMLKKEIVLAMESMHTIAETLITQEENIMKRLPPFFRKKVTQDMYHAQIKNCPLFASSGKEVIHRLAQVLVPYLGLEGDEVVVQGHLGEGMYLVTRGQVQIHVQDPKILATQGAMDGIPGSSILEQAGRQNIYAEGMDKMMFCDGAFFGELPCLGLGDGILRNKHIYTASCMTITQMCILKQKDLEAIERNNPTLKGQIRGLALERAERFGLDLSRITLTVEQSSRRLSIAMDDEAALASVDPDMADALSRVRTNSRHSNTRKKSAAAAADAPQSPKQAPGEPRKKKTFRRTSTDALLPVDWGGPNSNTMSPPSAMSPPTTAAAGAGDIAQVEARLNQRLDALAAQLQSLVDSQKKMEQTSLAGAPSLVSPQPPPGEPPQRGERR
jgi:CRP-like cAMP-binding protein